MNEPKLVIPRAESDGYNIHYSVLANGRFEAIAKATAMLRTGVKLHGVIEAEPSIPGWYDVYLHVTEKP